jgi:hypothetical protein
LNNGKEKAANPRRMTAKPKRILAKLNISSYVDAKQRGGRLVDTQLYIVWLVAEVT